MPLVAHCEKTEPHAQVTHSRPQAPEKAQPEHSHVKCQRGIELSDLRRMVIPMVWTAQKRERMATHPHENQHVGGSHSRTHCLGRIKGCLPPRPSRADPPQPYTAADIHSVTRRLTQVLPALTRQP